MLINFFNNLFNRQIPNPAAARSARGNAKERRVKKNKGIEAQREKPHTPTDALIGKEEPNEKQKK